jgi:hypothetical protein
VFQKDMQHRFTYANRAFCQLEELVGKTDDELYSVDLSTRYKQTDEQVIKSGGHLENRGTTWQKRWTITGYTLRYEFSRRGWMVVIRLFLPPCHQRATSGLPKELVKTIFRSKHRIRMRSMGRAGLTVSAQDTSFPH